MPPALIAPAIYRSSIAGEMRPACGHKRAVEKQGPPACSARQRALFAIRTHWPGRASLVLRPLCSSLGVGRHGRDGLQHLGRDLVGVALRVRTAVFEIALVAAVDERV